MGKDQKVGAKWQGEPVKTTAEVKSTKVPTVSQQQNAGKEKK